MGGHTLTLEEIGAANAPRAGLFARDMAELSRANLPVPKAFCLTADAYESRVDKLGLEDRLERVWGNDVSYPALGVFSDEIINAILAEGIDEELRQEISAAVEELGAPLIDVTLSPVVASYDAAAISGLGWSASYLPPEAAAEAAAECWAALWRQRQIIFRMRAGIEPRSEAPWSAAVLFAAADAAPLRGTVSPTVVEEGRVESWTVSVDPRLPSELKIEISVSKDKEEDAGSPLTASQAEALSILAEGAAAAIGEPKTLRWTFDGSRFTLTGILYK